jgi:alkanesulfonate monooxygenase SsuD/methylene tetrahydromethanopterin reductase-like flavin-dependent oxidoreductase (luciferase family)
MELGLYTFADMPASAGITPEQRMRNLLEEAELAEQVGLDVFGVGEHHRPDFVGLLTRCLSRRAGSAVGRLGLEPRSHGLTCRTGSHRPPACHGRCGLDHLFALDSTLGRAAYGL